jgi:exopolyphosphatase / guanosine-5'-triphosphate,3'-diphosphate pyrophosphatase
LLLAQFLRMAENLDRSHDGRIISASISPGGRRETILSIECYSDCTLEQWAIMEDARSFERTFKKRLTVEVSPQVRLTMKKEAGV